MFENGLGKNSEMKFLKILPIILLLQTGIILGEEGGYEFWTDEPKVEKVKVIREVVYVNQTSQISPPTIVIEDNDQIIITGVKHLGDGIFQYRSRTKNSNYSCLSYRISKGTTGGNGSCSGESYHYKVYWN